MVTNPKLRRIIVSKLKMINSPHIIFQFFCEKKLHYFFTHTPSEALPIEEKIDDILSKLESEIREVTKCESDWR